MGAVSFQLLDNEIFTPADIVDGRIYTSPTQNNLTGTTYPALKLIADYQDLQGTFGQVGVTAFVEAESEQGHWYPIAYQFNQFGAIGCNISGRLYSSQICFGLMLVLTILFGLKVKVLLHKHQINKGFSFLSGGLLLGSMIQTTHSSLYK